MHAFLGRTVACLAILTIGMAVTGPVPAVEDLSLDELARRTHIHDLAVDRRQRDQLLIATHHGLFRTQPGGRVQRVSAIQDLKRFSLDPGNPEQLYASGHPLAGGNLGLLVSKDLGATWQEILAGVEARRDYHQVAVSGADPTRLYVADDVLRVSTDSGQTWKTTSPLPEGLIDLATSATDPSRIYAATRHGLLRSNDSGKSWDALIERSPITMVEVAPDGTLYAFVVGQGLMRRQEDEAEFERVGAGDYYILRLATDPADPQRLFAATHDGSVIASSDGGLSWLPFEG